MCQPCTDHTPIVRFEFPEGIVFVKNLGLHDCFSTSLVANLTQFLNNLFNLDAWLTRNLVGFEGWLRAWDFVVFQELLELTPPQLHSILERDLWRVPKVSMIIEIQPEVWWLFGEIFYTQVRWRNPMHGLMECPKCCKWESDGQHRYCDMYRIHLSIWLDSFFQMKHYASTLNWPSDKSIKQHSMHSTNIYIYRDASPKSIAEPFDRW